LLSLVLRYGNFLDLKADPGKDFLRHWFCYYWAVLWTAYFCSMLLGLIVSTLSTSQEVAVATLPLIVLPQLLLTKVASGLVGGIAPRGWFDSLAVLVGGTEDPQSVARGSVGWAVELLSLLTYSRPALVFLLDFPGEHPSRTSAFWLACVNVSHLSFAVVATLAVLVFGFRFQERRWLERH
jgi:hypothetical protein